MEKQIGILSMQRVVNYGSFLQAYALKKLLIDLGAKSVYFIDIKPGKQLKGFKTRGIKYKLKRFKDLAVVVLHGRLLAKIKTRAFMSKVKEKLQLNYDLLGIKESEITPKQFDIAIIGSDEVFHCCQATSWGFTTQLYGNIPDAKKVYSYAGSFGATKIQDIKRLKINKEISNSLRMLQDISVRDNNSKYIVETLTGRIPRLNIDPVLAYGYARELETSKDTLESGYILVYSYPDRIKKKCEINAIKNFAKKHNKELVCVMSRYDWCDLSIIPDPLELLNWVKNADYIISETFHGTVFAIIGHRQFVTIGRSSSIEKLSSMLEPYGLTDRLLTNINSLDDKLLDPIDYGKIEAILSCQRIETQNYLKEIIQS